MHVAQMGIEYRNGTGSLKPDSNMDFVHPHAVSKLNLASTRDLLSVSAQSFSHGFPFSIRVFVTFAIIAQLTTNDTVVFCVW